MWDIWSVNIFSSVFNFGQNIFLIFFLYSWYFCYFCFLKCFWNICNLWMHAFILFSIFIKYYHEHLLVLLYTFHSHYWKEYTFPKRLIIHAFNINLLSAYDVQSIMVANKTLKLIFILSFHSSTTFSKFIWFISLKMQIIWFFPWKFWFNCYEVQPPPHFFL